VPPYEIVRATPAVARAQASWIAAIQPWRGLGYRAAPLGRYLARLAGHAPPGGVWIARGPGRRGAVAGIVAATDGFLLGGFIGILAVRSEASGQGIGGALVDVVQGRVFETRRWLFVSCDAENRAALRFYRRMGFARVGRLPDLVASGRIELLLRKSAGARAASRGKISVARRPRRLPLAGQ
jgi:ribosomal protein S18 acetylase RimI-like enzyme